MRWPVDARAVPVAHKRDTKNAPCTKASCGARVHRFGRRLSLGAAASIGKTSEHDAKDIGRGGRAVAVRGHLKHAHAAPRRRAAARRARRAAARASACRTRRSAASTAARGGGGRGGGRRAPLPASVRSSPAALRIGSRASTQGRCTSPRSFHTYQLCGSRVPVLGWARSTSRDGSAQIAASCSPSTQLGLTVAAVQAHAPAHQLGLEAGDGSRSTHAAEVAICRLLGPEAVDLPGEREIGREQRLAVLHAAVVDARQRHVAHDGVVGRNGQHQVRLVVAGGVALHRAEGRAVRSRRHGEAGAVPFGYIRPGTA